MKSPAGSPQQETKTITKKRKSLTKAKGSSSSLDSSTALLTMDETEDVKAASNFPMKSNRRRSLTKSKGSGSKLVADPSKSEDANSAKVASSHLPVKSKRRRSLSKSKGSSSSLGHEPSKTEEDGSVKLPTATDGVDETDLAMPSVSAQPFKKAPMKFSATNSFMKSLQAHQVKNEGLNSLLDSSPMPSQPAFEFKKRIKHQLLREFYGNSVNSPNLTEVPSAVITVRRSPRFAGK